MVVSRTIDECNSNYNYGLLQIENIKVPIVKANGRVAIDKAGKEKIEHKYSH